MGDDLSIENPDQAASSLDDLLSGIANQTIRHNGSNWVATSNVANDGTDLTVSGGLVVLDATPQIRFDTGSFVGSLNWTPTITRTITLQDGDGTVAFLSDIGGTETLSATLVAGNTTGANDISVNTGQQILLIGTAQVRIGTASQILRIDGSGNVALEATAPGENILLRGGNVNVTATASSLFTVTSNINFDTPQTNFGTTSLIGATVGIRDATSDTGATTLAIQKSNLNPVIHAFDNGSVNIGFATNLGTSVLFIRDTYNFGTALDIFAFGSTGSPRGINISVSGATAGTNTAIRASAGNAVANICADFRGGDILNTATLTDSWAIGATTVSTTIKFNVVVNTGSIHSTIGRFETGNTLTTNTALEGICSGAGTNNIAGTFSATGGINNYGLLVTAGLVGIGTATPNASSVLDLTSTTGALLLPRMTTVQRDALTAVEGMLVANITTNQLNYHNGTSWVIAA